MTPGEKEKRKAKAVPIGEYISKYIPGLDGKKADKTS